MARVSWEESALSRSRVLIVDDEENQRSALATMVSAWGYETEIAGNGVEALAKLQTFNAHALITDLMMPQMDNTVRDLGAFWFLEKPIQAHAMRMLLERAVSQSRLSEQADILRRQLSNHGVLGDMVGGSAAMQEVFALIRQGAPSKATVLVTGESGTGKELVARAIHTQSPRRNGPFVAINCAALPEALMESELFGNEKGAYTGAVERRAGCFELAQQGTLLLDEIGDMPLSTQAKLLRVLEDSKVRRLGASKEQQVDVRVVASTNQKLEQAIADSKFREDLFYRLNVFHISLPPLRERKEDLPSLCNALIEGLNRKHQTRVTDLQQQVLETFFAHSWPGNVRELRNVLERAIILAGEGTVKMIHLPKSFGLLPTSKTMLDAAVAASAASAGGDDQLLRVTLPVGTTLDQAERELIDITLKHTNNNRTRAADILGISIKTLFNKLKEAQG